MPTKQLKTDNHYYFCYIQDHFTKKPFSQGFTTKNGKLLLPLRRMRPGDRFDFTITSNALFNRIRHAVRIYAHRTKRHFVILRWFRLVSICEVTEGWEPPTPVRDVPTSFNFAPSPKNKNLSYPFTKMTVVGDSFALSNSPELVAKVTEAMRKFESRNPARFTLSIASKNTAVVQRVA